MQIMCRTRILSWSVLHPRHPADERFERFVGRLVGFVVSSQKLSKGNSVARIESSSSKQSDQLVMPSCHGRLWTGARRAQDRTGVVQ